MPPNFKGKTTADVPTLNAKYRQPNNLMKNQKNTAKIDLKPQLPSINFQTMIKFKMKFKDGHWTQQ